MKNLVKKRKRTDLVIEMVVTRSEHRRIMDQKIQIWQSAKENLLKARLLKKDQQNLIHLSVENMRVDRKIITRHTKMINFIKDSLRSLRSTLFFNQIPFHEGEIVEHKENLKDWEESLQESLENYPEIYEA